MRLIITGGSGFLGYHLSRSLARDYQEILLLDRIPPDGNNNPPNVRYCPGDVRDRAFLDEHFQSQDVVVHAAAALPLEKQKDILDINIQGTQAVLDTALRQHVERVIFLSSTAVYGIPQACPLNEEAPLQGIGPYGKSKIEAEKLCQYYWGKGLCVSIVRPQTFIGQGRLGVFQILYDWIECGRRIPIVGRGTNRYQLLEVEDLVQAIRLLCQTPPEKARAIFNVGAQEFGTVAEDLEALCRFAGSGARVMRTPAVPVKSVLYLLERLGLSPLYEWLYRTADRDFFVSSDKIKNTLGYQPQFSNAQALIRSYQWYLEHQEKMGAPGITHRSAWKQGALQIFKRFL